MKETVNAAARRTRLRFMGLLGLAALALAGVALAGWHGKTDDVGGVGMAGGPLSINAGDTGLAFVAPEANRRWSATAGTFLLCGDGPVVVEAVTPIRSSRLEGFEARVRQFRIRAIPGGRRVSEPLLGGYGTPPKIGGADGPPYGRLLGALQAAEGVRLERLPPCSKTTNLPGEDAVELLITATAGPAGALVDGVRVAYEADGRQYEQRISVALDLCGAASRSPDC